MKILAIDLGKFKSTACVLESTSGEHRFTTIRTVPGEVHDLLAARQGHGKSAARAAACHALNVGLVPQWRTLASNVASVGAGRSLGFTTWATHFFVRLAPDDLAT
jgi:hypothetical protein